jgi:hypothetical protein
MKFSLLTAGQAASAVFTSAAMAAPPRAEAVAVTAFANAASAANGLQLHGSMDGAGGWVPLAQVALVASTPRQLVVADTMPFYRVVLTNGAAPSTVVNVALAFCESAPAPF